MLKTLKNMYFTIKGFLKQYLRCQKQLLISFTHYSFLLPVTFGQRTGLRSSRSSEAAVREKVLMLNLDWPSSITELQ